MPFDLCRTMRCVQSTSEASGRPTQAQLGLMMLVMMPHQDAQTAPSILENLNAVKIETVSLS